MKQKMNLLLPIFLSCFIKFVKLDESIQIIRGVSLKEQSLFNPASDFTCFDGSRIVPFDSVNDDFCDCVDGSDEPGTSACPEGRFFCENSGHKSKFIQSSRVNDGICDCCDGSDEYDSSVVCFNKCNEEGKEERIRLEQEFAEQTAGFEVRKNYIQIGADKKREKKARSDVLNQLLEERRTKLEELKTLKEAAEAPEKEAKDKHQNEWNEIQNAKKKEQEAKDCLEAFGKLDLDSNGWVQFAELMSNNYLNFDMPEQDAKDFLGGEALVDGEGFEKIWPNVKDRFLKDGRPKAPEETEESAGNTESEESAGNAESEESVTKETEEQTEGESETVEEKIAKFKLDQQLDGEDDDEDGDDDDIENDPDLKSSGDDHPDITKTHTSKTEETMPDYDEATKVLIAEADKARQEFDEADKQVRDLESEQSTINTFLGVDFGPEDEFSALKGECFEFTDREYVYKLCPFDRVTQRSKNGGSDTDLGQWGNWQDGYKAMKYTGGAGCWNGPARSTLVHLSCGKENALLSSAEPSRCEYEMEFKTPSLCSQVNPTGHGHTEL